MKAFVHLRDTRDGHTYVHEVDWDFGDECGLGSSEFAWTDGNYSCDCNRGIFMYKDYDFKCNVDKNLIVIDKVVSEAGVMLECEAV